MQVDSLHYDPVDNLAVLGGNLARTVSGGNLSTRVRLVGLPANIGRFERMKLKAAWAVSAKKRRKLEPFCSLLGRNLSCPIAPGKQELRFKMNKLPNIVMVGEYVLEANATDASGNPVACIKASLSVPPVGNEVTRKLLEGAGRRLCSGGGAEPYCHICEGEDIDTMPEAGYSCTLVQSCDGAMIPGDLIEYVSTSQCKFIIGADNWHSCKNCSTLMPTYEGACTTYGGTWAPQTCGQVAEHWGQIMAGYEMCSVVQQHWENTACCMDYCAWDPNTEIGNAIGDIVASKSPCLIAGLLRSSFLALAVALAAVYAL